MTWSIAHEMNFKADSLSAAASHDAGGPLQYHFETFLPAHGWTVTAEGETGGAAKNSEERWYGISRTVTHADGRSRPVAYIVELEYNSQGDISYYSWSGIPGEGAAANLYTSSSFNPFPVQGLSLNYKWLVSDEDPDAWFLLFGGDNKSEMVGGSFPYSTLSVDPLDDNTMFLPLMAEGVLKTFTGLTCYASSGAAFRREVRILNPNFALQISSAADCIGFNQQTDIMLKHNVTALSNIEVASEFCSSVLIGNDYWLDLRPQYSRSLLLKTATDLGVL